MTTTQIILGIILILLYILIHILIFIRMRKVNKKTSRILEELLPPKDKEQSPES